MFFVSSRSVYFQAEDGIRALCLSRGLGTLCIGSFVNRDYPVIQTYVLLIGVLFVLFNLLFDILQTVSDPRLRKGDA